MISRAIKTVTRLRSAFHFGSYSSVDPEMIATIGNYSPLFEYPKLQPIIRPHEPHQHRFMEGKVERMGDTELSYPSYVIEEGGFPSCSDIGIVIKMGTQNETEATAGSLFHLRNFVHIKSDWAESVKNYEFLQKTGSSFDFIYGVTQSYIRCSFFEQDLDVILELLLDLAFRKKMLRSIDKQLSVVEEAQTVSDLTNITELVRMTAFNHKGIGMASKGNGNILKNSEFLNFQSQFVTPSNTYISLTNLANPDQIVNTINQRLKHNYAEYLSRPKSVKPSSQYVGGVGRYMSDLPTFQFACAFPGAALRDANMEMYHILRVILGQASSFSTGGPGKGMHSRCTKNLLNAKQCVERASYINEQYDTHGLFGLLVGGPHTEKSNVIECTMKELAKLAQPIPEQELERAKRILMTSIHTNIEQQSVRMEEVTKHIPSYGRIKLSEFNSNIERVTSQQICEQMKRMLTRTPTYVISGNEETHKPTGEVLNIQKYLKK